MISQIANSIFDKSINEYHIKNEIDAVAVSPYHPDTIEHLLYVKNWVDTAQWHMEDVVRNPQIDPIEGLGWKRRIDAQNQVRTDMVEFIDSYFLKKYSSITADEDARLNTESVAWALDRLSILALKIFHMKEEAERKSASEEHRASCTSKLNVLLTQKADLSKSIDELVLDIEQGKKIMKAYKQMKMYNDPSLNPVLYSKS